MKIYAILTGRGGSKLKNKNILKINGKPCLQYPCDAAKQVKLIDKFYSSSDDKNILKLTTKLGYEKINRPKILSRDTTKHIDVIKHALNFIKRKEKIIPEIIIVLLANAPIIKSKWISECLNYLEEDKSITAAVPVVEDNDHHPLRAKKTKNGFTEWQKSVQPKNNKLNALLYLLDGTNQISQSEFLNSSNIPNNPIFGDLKDIVEPNHAIDKFFLSAKACAGILRRKNERNMNMNSELEILLTRISKGEKIQTEKKSQHVTLCISNSGLSTRNEGVSVNQSSVLT